MISKYLTCALIALSTTASFAKKARTILLNDNKTESIVVAPGRSVILNFPMRPSKVIVGGKGLFAVEYIESDLALTALKSGAHSNLFVYLEGRRFGFDLSTGSPGDEIVLVRDSADRKMKVKPHD